MSHIKDFTVTTYTDEALGSAILREQKNLERWARREAIKRVARVALPALLAAGGIFCLIWAYKLAVTIAEMLMSL